LDVLEGNDEEKGDDTLIDESLCKDVARALAFLTEREAGVISYSFGLQGTNSMTLEEIGVRFNLTPERVRQIKEKALSRLRHVSRARVLESFLG
jgi:RNA polymerase primary sigma factor